MKYSEIFDLLIDEFCGSRCPLTGANSETGELINACDNEIDMCPYHLKEFMQYLLDNENES